MFVQYYVNLLSSYILLSSATNTVMLQSGDLPEQDRSKHKFMVQTMIAPNDDESFPDSLVSSVHSLTHTYIRMYVCFVSD